MSKVLGVGASRRMEDLEEKVQSAQHPEDKSSEASSQNVASLFVPIAPYTLLSILTPQSRVLGPESHEHLSACKKCRLNVPPRTYRIKIFTFTRCTQGGPYTH